MHHRHLVFFLCFCSINEIEVCILRTEISDLKAQKMIILWTLKHVSAISEHPVLVLVLLKLECY